MPRRNSRRSRRTWYSHHHHQPSEKAQRPNTDVLALDLVKRGIAPPLILGPMNPRFGADLHRILSTHQRGTTA